MRMYYNTADKEYEALREKTSENDEQAALCITIRMQMGQMKMICAM
mgnify:CR=1 FL=1